MSLLRLLLYMLGAWLGGVWVFFGGDALANQSWTSAWWALGGTIALIVGLVAFGVRDVQNGRISLRRITWRS